MYLDILQQREKEIERERCRDIYMYMTAKVVLNYL